MIGETDGDNMQQRSLAGLEPGTLLGHGECLNPWGPPERPHVDIFFSFPFDVPHRHTSQMVCYLVAHRWVLTGVLCFSVFCPVHAVPAPWPRMEMSKKRQWTRGVSSSYIPTHTMYPGRTSGRTGHTPGVKQGKIVGWSLWVRRKALLCPYWNLSKQEATCQRSLRLL